MNWTSICDVRCFGSDLDFVGQIHVIQFINANLMISGPDLVGSSDDKPVDTHGQMWDKLLDRLSDSLHHPHINIDSASFGGLVQMSFNYKMGDFQG